MMKRGLAFLFLLTVFAIDVCAQQAGQFGAGVILGRPSGLTAKTWYTGSNAFDLGVGFGEDFTFYADHLWHGWDIFPQPAQGKLGGYVGIGPRIEADRHAEFGIRTIGGLSYWIANRPIELFLEGGPVFQLAPDRDVEVDAGVGVRFYFGPKR